MWARKETTMSELEILRAEHEVLVESGEFALGLNTDVYAFYVQGVLDMTTKLLPDDVGNDDDSDVV